MKSLPRDLLRGTIFALLAGTGSILLARYAFTRLYYLSVLLPAVMLAMLLVAWLIHLKEDGFFRGARQEPSSERISGPQDSKGRPFLVSFDEEVLERSFPSGKPAFEWSSRDVMRALLWGAVELGLLSIALYHWAGIGPRFLR